MSAHRDTREGAVTFLTPQPENIPDELKALPWACWDPKPRPAGGYAKAPIHPMTGRMLRTNRPDEWLDYGTCLRHVADGRRTGFGLLLDGTTDLIGIDLDKVKVLFPQYPEVARLVSQYRKAGGYIEWSPSGTGLRLFCRGSMPFDGKRKGGILQGISHEQGQAVSVLGNGRRAGVFHGRQPPLNSGVRTGLASGPGQGESRMNAPTRPLLFDDEGRPVFPCREARGQFLFTCPQCGQRNAHGAITGHRAAHCDCWPGGYWVIRGDEPGGPKR